MGDGIYAAVAGARAEADRIAMIANNLANLRTAGFKADRPLFEEALCAGMDQSYVAPRGTAPDLAQGSLQRTGNPLDLAIEGEGFFVVETPRGERLTRAGAFARSESGELVTRSGLPVVGSGGSILIGKGTIHIEEDGTVQVDGKPLGRIRLVELEDGNRVYKAGGSLFIPRDPDLLREPAEGRIRQGYIEASNVNPAETMVRLISAQRTFEALMNSMRNYKELDSRLAQISRL